MLNVFLSYPLRSTRYLTEYFLCDFSLFWGAKVGYKWVNIALHLSLPCQSLKIFLEILLRAMPILLPCRVASFRYKQIRGVNVSVTLNLKKSEK